MCSHVDTIRRALQEFDLEIPQAFDATLATDALAALDALVAENQQQAQEIKHLRDRAVCDGCGSDVSESGACLRECGGGVMIPAIDLPWALRQMRESRDEERAEAEVENQQLRDALTEIERFLRGRGFSRHANIARAASAGSDA